MASRTLSWAPGPHERAISRALSIADERPVRHFGPWRSGRWLSWYGASFPDASSGGTWTDALIARTRFPANRSSVLTSSIH